MGRRSTSGSVERRYSMQWLARGLICKKSAEMSTEMTEPGSSSGGLAGWWMYSISHSKMWTSQCTEMSISSNRRSSARYGVK